MKREIKAARKQAIVALLNEEQKNLHHNARRGWVREWDSLSEKTLDALYEELNFYDEMTLQDINSGAAGDEYIEGYVRAMYGRVGRYGRSGATCAPEGWIDGKGLRNSIKTTDAEDISYGKAYALYCDVKAWNEYVRAYNSPESLRDMMSGWIEERRAEVAEHNKAYAAMLII